MRVMTSDGAARAMSTCAMGTLMIRPSGRTRRVIRPRETSLRQIMLICWCGEIPLRLPSSASVNPGTARIKVSTRSTFVVTPPKQSFVAETAPATHRKLHEAIRAHLPR
jgi:hypothetical protein